MGAIGEPGGVNLHVTNKFVPKHPNPPPAPDYWNELLFPKEFPLAFFEMSFLLPHFLKEGRGRLDMYFTRVYNPLWTNPDGFSWMESAAGRVEDRHARRAHADLERDGVVRRLRPADGPRHRAARHDEPGNARGPLARLPPAGRARRDGKAGQARRRTRTRRTPAKCGKRPSSGSRSRGRSIPTARSASASSSNRRTGRASRSRWTSTTAGSSRTPCRACRTAAKKEDLTPLQYMRKYGVFKVDDVAYSKAHEQPLRRRGAARRRRDRAHQDGTRRRRHRRRRARASTRRHASSSSTRRRWPRGAGRSTRFRATCPGHVYWRDLDRAANEFDLLPNFRLPTLVHTRSPVKWLYEISHNNPLWIATRGRGDARHRGRRSREGHDGDRLLRHARLGHRRHPPRRRRHVAPPRPLAARTRNRAAARSATALVRIAHDGDGPLRDAAGPRRAAVRRATTPTAAASGGARSACTRT